MAGEASGKTKTLSTRRGSFEQYAVYSQNSLSETARIMGEKGFFGPVLSKFVLGSPQVAIAI